MSLSLSARLLLLVRVSTLSPVGRDGSRLRHEMHSKTFSTLKDALGGGVFRFSFFFFNFGDVNSES